MAHHITYCSYDKLDISNGSFITGLREFNYNTLVTEKDFEDALEMDCEKQEILDDIEREIGTWYPTIDHETIYRQCRVGESHAMSRFMVSFTFRVREQHIEKLKSLGFRISITPIKYMGSSTEAKMVIIAEQCVNLEDAIQWASKFDLRDYAVSKGSPPITFPPYIFETGPGRSGNLLDTQEVLQYCIEHGIEKAQAHFGYFSSVYDIEILLKRIENVKNNEKFQDDYA